MTTIQNFAGKTVVVTGAAGGIGRGIAVEFGREGATVVLADLDRAGLEESARLIAGLGSKATTATVDVRDGQQLHDLAARIDDEFGGTDVLCNNAGVFRGGLVWENPIADWEWVMSVNFYGIIHGLRAFVPRMIERGTTAHIVNTASMAGLVATGMSGIYTASKFAVVALSESLARDLESVGAPIDVSVLCPGAVATRIAESQRNREELTEVLESADAIEAILGDFCASGIDPIEVGPMVTAAIRNGDFVIPTRDTFGDFLQLRSDALSRRQLPPFQMFD